MQKVERSIFSIGLDQLFELFDQLLVFLPLGLIERFVIVVVRRRFQMVIAALPDQFGVIPIGDIEVDQPSDPGDRSRAAVLPAPRFSGEGELARVL